MEASDITGLEYLSDDVIDDVQRFVLQKNNIESIEILGKEFVDLKSANQSVKNYLGINSTV